MKTNISVIALILAFALVATPAFAQQGRGLGVGLGVQTKGGVGGGPGAGVNAGAGAQVGKGNVGVRTNTEVQAKTSGQGKAGEAVDVDAKGHDAPNANLTTKIQSNPAVAAKVQSMLPTGMSMSDASAGFKNQGQFIAALHVSQNLKIPFDQLKAKMTGDHATSLGAAIQASRPDLPENQVKEEVKKAETEAKVTASAKAAATTTANIKSSEKK